MAIEIIAEAGVSHLGNVHIAKKMARAAKLAGCDAVKYQTYVPWLQYPDGSAQQEQITDWTLSQEEWLSLVDYCRELNIEFMSTPGDIPSLEFLVERCCVKRIKIGSDDLTNYPLLEAAKKTGLPLIVSTGMATLAEIWRLFPLLRDCDTTLLHCVSSYPCAFEDANLKAIPNLEDEFGCRSGYSDHCPGYLACVAAAAMGAKVIEKHFMLKEHRDCPDKEVSIYDNQLRHMVNDIRMVERMLGTGEKVPCEAEQKNIPLLRKGPNGLRAI